MNRYSPDTFTTTPSETYAPVDESTDLTEESNTDSTLEPKWEAIQLPASFQSTHPTKRDAKSRDAKSPRYGRFLRLIVLVAGCLTAFLIFMAGLKYILPKEYKSSVDTLTLGMLPTADPTFSVLVMGVDSNGNRMGDTYSGTRTDTMLLVKPNVKEQSLNVISLPRDSKVYLDDMESRVGKLNAAHAIGGPDKTRLVIEDSLGIAVNKYVAVDFRAVRALVDAVGGIDIYVPQRMRYTDNTAKLRINLQTGWTHMDGKTAEGFLRFRHDAYGDIGRVRRQQQFIGALRNRLNSPDVVLRLPELISVVSRYVKTNMSPTELLQFANYAKKVPTQDTRFATLPGHTSSREGTSYWIIDRDETEQLLARLLYGTPLAEEDENGEPLPEVKKVGLVYSRKISTEELTALTDELTALGWEISCRQASGISSTSIMDNTLRLTQTGIQSLQGASPLLGTARVTFVPRTSSLAPERCGSEQITLYIGSDVVTQKESTKAQNE